MTTDRKKIKKIKVTLEIGVDPEQADGFIIVPTSDARLLSGPNSVVVKIGEQQCKNGVTLKPL